MFENLANDVSLFIGLQKALALDSLALANLTTNYIVTTKA